MPLVPRYTAKLSLKALWPDLQWGWRPQTGHRANVLLRFWPAQISERPFGEVISNKVLEVDGGAYWVSGPLLGAAWARQRSEHRNLRCAVRLGLLGAWKPCGLVA